MIGGGGFIGEGEKGFFDAVLAGEFLEIHFCVRGSGFEPNDVI